jgi:protein-tyrosine phosphatase
MTPLDYACVNDTLCLGSYPPAGHALALHGFDLLLLCAEELQDRDTFDHPGVEVWHCGFEDGPLTPAIIDAVNDLADDVAEQWKQGRAILITCRAGINRSALVTALAYRRITGSSGAQAMAAVRAVRPGALINPFFSRYLARLPAIGRP